MSVTLDTNVLVYAANASDPAHRKARDLLERLARGPDLLFLFWPAIMGFLRISTSPGIFASPYTPEEALAAIADLNERPHVRVPTEEPGFLGAYQTTAPGARGALVPDAHLATLMRQHGVAVIYTHDRGFRRFDGISVQDPFA